MSTQQFWSNDFTVLFNQQYIFEICPSASMSYEEKLNSITRLVILITFIGYFLTRDLRVFFSGCIILFIIYVLYKTHYQYDAVNMFKENFDNSNINKNININNTNLKINSSDVANTYVNPATLEEVLKTDYMEGTKKNPFSNVLLTQINGDPERKAAPPAFNVDVSEDITTNIKRSVQMMNPEIKNTNKQLYGDLYQNFELDQANRVFYSTANTRVANDQTSYAKFLYGDMPSAKESTPEGDIQRVKDNFRYNLY
jgi:hypothetical protein